MFQIIDIHIPAPSSLACARYFILSDSRNERQAPTSHSHSYHHPAPSSGGGGGGTQKLKFAPVTPDTVALNGQLPTGTRSLTLRSGILMIDPV